MSEMGAPANTLILVRGHDRTPGAWAICRAEPTLRYDPPEIWRDVETGTVVAVGPGPHPTRKTVEELAVLRSRLNRETAACRDLLYQIDALRDRAMALLGRTIDAAIEAEPGTPR